MRRLGGIALGIAAALMPVYASAQQPGGRALDRSIDAGGDVGLVVVLTVFGLVALFAVAALGYLYRRERGLDWGFQRPEPPHEDHH